MKSMSLDSFFHLMKKDAALVELHPCSWGWNPLVTARLLVFRDFQPLKRLLRIVREFMHDTLKHGSIAWPLWVISVGGFSLTRVFSPEHTCAGACVL